MDPAQQGLEHLERIEEDLEAIKERTGSSKRSFINGIFQGAGVVIGTVAAIALLGWVLSFLNVFPALANFVGYLHDVVQREHN